MERMGNFVLFGDVPYGSMGNSCGPCYCLSSVGYPTGGMRILPIGSGVPIPSSWLCIEASMVDTMIVDGMVIPDDDGAAMMRIAVRLASEGRHFPASNGFEEPDMNSSWQAEASICLPRLSYLNSIYSNFILSSGKDIGFSFSGKRFKPMVVGGNMSWATRAVFDGYVESLSTMGVDVVSFEYDQFMKMFSEDIVRKILVAEACDVDNAITHMIVIDGMSIPKNVVRTVSRCGVATVLVTTEDPHSSDVTRRLYGLYDHVFSNDRNMAEACGVGYLPTASSISQVVEREKDIDVLFVGAVYPNRLEFLSSVADACMGEGISFKVIGPEYGCVAGPPLSSCMEKRMVSPSECMNLQARAKLCLNVFRDEMCTVTSKNNEMAIPAYSMNPRCYDVFMCNSMLLTDYRQEVVDIFGAECLYGENPEAKIIDIIKNFDKWKDIADKCRKKVVEGNLYIHRSMTLLSCVGQGFFV